MEKSNSQIERGGGVREEGKRIKGDREGVSAQKPPPRDSEGDVERASEEERGREDECRTRRGIIAEGLRSCVALAKKS